MNILYILVTLFLSYKGTWRWALCITVHFIWTLTKHICDTIPPDKPKENSASKPALPYITVMYILWKHMKLKMLVTSLALQQIKGVGAVTRQEDIMSVCTCKIQWYIILMLSLLILGLMLFFIQWSQKLKLCRGHLFSSAVKIMLFISDAQYDVPVEFCRMAGSIHLFKITGTLVPENVKLKWHLIWDVIELDGKGVNMTLNRNKINLPNTITIKFQDKFKIRWNVKGEPLLFHIMLKQGFTWYTRYPSRNGLWPSTTV